MTINDKIREEYGTIKRFCKIEGIKYNTLNVVLSGYGSSKPIAKRLKQLGIIENINEVKDLRKEKMR